MLGCTGGVLCAACASPLAAPALLLALLLLHMLLSPTGSMQLGHGLYETDAPAAAGACQQLRPAPAGPCAPRPPVPLAPTLNGVWSRAPRESKSSSAATTGLVGRAPLRENMDQLSALAPSRSTPACRAATRGGVGKNPTGTPVTRQGLAASSHAPGCTFLAPRAQCSAKPTPPHPAYRRQHPRCAERIHALLGLPTCLCQCCSDFPAEVACMLHGSQHVD